MSEEENGVAKTASQEELQDMIAESDTGGRTPSGISAKVLWSVPLGWSLFQLWYVSPLPFMFNIGLINSTQARSIHLAIAVFLAFLAFPALKKSPRHYIPIMAWILALGGHSAPPTSLFFTLNCPSGRGCRRRWMSSCRRPAFVLSWRPPAGRWGCP